MISKIKTIIRGFFGIIENQEKIPNISLERINIGFSANKNPIKAYKMGEGKKTVLLMSGVHGNEIGTIKLTSKLANLLKTNPVKDLTLYIVPVLNVDGFNNAIKKPDYFNGGAIGRTNSNNVDLNRNFDTKSWTKDGVWEFGAKKVKVSGGKAPFSEPETKALVEFIKDNKIEVIFDFHNRAGTVLATNDRLGKETAEVYSKESGYKNITGSTWQNTGWSKNYFEGLGITYVEIETRKRWGSDWENNEKAVVESLKLIASSK